MANPLKQTQDILHKVKNLHAYSDFYLSHLLDRTYNCQIRATFLSCYNYYYTYYYNFNNNNNNNNYYY